MRKLSFLALGLTAFGLAVSAAPTRAGETGPPALTILKEQSVGGRAFTTATFPVTPGDVITYRLTVGNAGTGQATNTIVTDFIPANTTYVPGSTTISSGGAAQAVNDTSGGLTPLALGANVGTLAPFPINGYFRILSFQVRVNLGVPPTTTTGQTTSTTQICNSATVSSDQTGRLTSNQVCVNVTGLVILTITKTANPTSVAQRVGTTTFTVTVANTGNASSTNTIVRDTLPAGLAYVANSTTLRGAAVADVGGTSPLLTSAGLNIDGLAPGASAVITFQALVSDCPAVGTQFTNTASVSSDQTTSVSASATITVTPDLTPPVITFTQPAPGATFTPCDVLTVCFNINAGCNTIDLNTIVVRINGVVVTGTLVNQGNGNFCLVITDLSSVAIGPATITVTAATTTGVTATASLPINFICTIDCAIEFLRRAQAAGNISATVADLIRTSLLVSKGAGSTAARCEALRCALCFVRSEERRFTTIPANLLALDREIVCLLASCPASTRIPAMLF